MPTFPPTITEFDSALFLASGNVDAGRLAFDGTNFWQAVLGPGNGHALLLNKYAASGTFVASYNFDPANWTGDAYATIVAIGSFLWIGGEATAGNNPVAQVQVTAGVPSLLGTFLFAPVPSTGVDGQPEMTTDGTSLYVLEQYQSSGTKVVTSKVNPTTGAVIWQSSPKTWSVTTSTIATDNTYVYYAVDHKLYQDLCSSGANHQTHDGTGGGEFITWVVYDPVHTVLWAWDNSGNQNVLQFNVASLTVSVTLPGSNFFPVSGSNNFQALSTDSAGDIWICFYNQDVVGGHNQDQMYIAVYDPTGVTQLYLHAFTPVAPVGGTTFPANGPLYNLALVGTTMWGAILSGMNAVPSSYQYALLEFSFGTPLTIICASPPPAVPGVFYSHQFPASGGTPPYTFTIIGGTVPPRLTLDPATGILSGIPLVGGTFTFTIQVTSS